jgi:hypothetical protein
MTCPAATPFYNFTRYNKLLRQPIGDILPSCRLIPLDDDLKRDFYVEMCRIERWSTRTLEKKISMFFRSTATAFTLRLTPI